MAPHVEELSEHLADAVEEEEAPEYRDYCLKNVKTFYGGAVLFVKVEGNDLLSMALLRKAGLTQRGLK